MTQLTDIYSFFKDDLTQVNQIIRTHLSSNLSPSSQAIIDHSLKSSGKQLRPLLTLTFLYLIEPNPTPKQTQDFHTLCAAIELIHAASLIHDDMIDQATTRRGIETVHHAFDSSAGIISGVYYYATSLELIARLESIEILDCLSQVVKTMCQGEFDEGFLNQNSSIDHAQQILHSKTTRLMEACAQCAHFLLKKPLPESMLNFCTAFGTIFQLSDDFIDYFGSDDTLKKQVGQDLSQQIFNIPILLLIDQLKDDEKTTFINEFKSQQLTLEQVQFYLKKYKVDELLLKIIKKHYQTCTQSLQNIDESQYCHFLESFLNLSLNRIDFNSLSRAL